MKKIFLFGAGKSSEVVENNLIAPNVEILGYVDNNISKHGISLNGRRIISPKDLLKEVYDYIIIGTVYYESIIKQLLHMGIIKNKIIVFFSKEYYESDAYFDIISEQSWKNEAFRKQTDVKYERLEKRLYAFMNNMKYETAELLQKGKLEIPIIESSESLIDLIVKKRCSLSRYGDGEFEIMRGEPRHNFQKANFDLGKRMREILISNLENHIVGIAPYYADISQYDDEAQDAIRTYMTPEVRRFHYQVLSMEKVYYDACISRPYVMYRDKEGVQYRFQNLRRLWQDRKILIVEGLKTRMGVGNDLLSNSVEIRRILGPTENAFDFYDELLNCVIKNASYDELILIALGATATVLAFDLAKKGFQAIDIGHVDLEYEWYLAGKGKRTEICNKYNNEIPGGNYVEDINDSQYSCEIIAQLVGIGDKDDSS